MHFTELYTDHPAMIVWLLILTMVVPTLANMIFDRMFGNKTGFGRLLLGGVIFFVVSLVASDLLVHKFLYLQSTNTPEMNVWNEARVKLTLVFNVVAVTYLMGLFVNKAIYRQDNVVYYKTSLVTLFLFPILGFVFTQVA
ncbi:MAG TPA: hypothetical protein VFV52_00320 [Bacilli bacterium]|nr:hypothetical protein [Bacilli bacterium]